MAARLGPAPGMLRTHGSLASSAGPNVESPKFDVGEHIATVITAAPAIWNVGVALVVGSAVDLVARRSWLKL
jgi:hypothetical protein